MEIKIVPVQLLNSTVYDYHIDGKVFTDYKEAVEYHKNLSKKTTLKGGLQVETPPEPRPTLPTKLAEGRKILALHPPLNNDRFYKFLQDNDIEFNYCDNVVKHGAEYLRINEVDLKNPIRFVDCFSWIESEQGIEYWMKINEKWLNIVYREGLE